MKISTVILSIRVPKYNVCNSTNCHPALYFKLKHTGRPNYSLFITSVFRVRLWPLTYLQASISISFGTGFRVSTWIKMQQFNVLLCLFFLLLLSCFCFIHTCKSFVGASLGFKIFTVNFCFSVIVVYMTNKELEFEQ